MAICAASPFIDLMLLLVDTRGACCLFVSLVVSARLLVANFLYCLHSNVLDLFACCNQTTCSHSVGSLSLTLLGGKTFCFVLTLCCFQSSIELCQLVGRGELLYPRRGRVGEHFRLTNPLKLVFASEDKKSCSSVCCVPVGRSSVPGQRRLELCRSPLP